MSVLLAAAPVALPQNMEVDSRSVKRPSAALSPFVRSDALGAVLAETLLHPDGELSITDLARRAGIGVSLAHKEVGRLVEEEVLRDRREGNSRLVRANTEHPLYEPMSRIVAATYGPVPVLRELLGEVDGVQQAYVYGSWAARRSGEPGRFPRDVDVLVVGTATRSALAEVGAAARERLGVEVNVHRTDPRSWAQPEGNPFLETVAARPRVTVIDTDRG
jgi:predicted nucleotidyltransferase